jgi:sulfate permease, SulP family
VAVNAHRPANIAALVLVVGAVMGLPRLGAVMNFVSNAVMTGFTTGIALQIVVGIPGVSNIAGPQVSTAGQSFES